MQNFRFYATITRSADWSKGTFFATRAVGCPRLFNIKSKFKKAEFWLKSQFSWKLLNSKITILVKNRNFGQKIIVFITNQHSQKSQFWSKNHSFPHKSTFSKITILVKTRNFAQKITIFLKNNNFGRKPQFCSKHHNFSQKSQFSSKITIFLKNHNFPQKSQFF